MEAFILEMGSDFSFVARQKRITVDSEPGLYRHTEIAGDGYRAFELTSLLPKTGFDLHVAKMTE